MQQTITIKGTGQISAPVDWIEIHFDLSVINPDFQLAMEWIAQGSQAINILAEAVGLPKDNLAISSFSTNTVYRTDNPGVFNTRRKFDGYKIRQVLHLGFTYNLDLLGNLLAGVSKLKNMPSIDIGFTVKDKSALKQELLINATKDAHQTAEVLVCASEKTLGELLCIQYSWDEINFYSKTSVEFEDDYFTDFSELQGSANKPKDITVSDTVDFVWAIV